MINHAGILGYFIQAGPVVKSVMMILLFASIACWTLIFQRAWYYRKIKQQYDAFIERFWASGDLNQFYRFIDSNQDSQEGIAAIFHAGFKEFLRLCQNSQSYVEPIQRMMQIRHSKEAERLEQHLPFFASVGSIAPYIGLFGTVWGIMTSFQALGNAQQATIAMVAPGISEALVATALGLFTAIPAVIAYNRFTTRTATILSRYDLFQEELIALIAQQTTTTDKGQKHET